jgi:hypothetical protein
VGVTAADGGDEPIARGWAAEAAAGQIVLPGLFHLTLVQHELGFGGGGAPGAVLELVGEGADIAGGIPEGEVVGWEHPGPLWQDVAQLGSAPALIRASTSAKSCPARRQSSSSGR